MGLLDAIGRIYNVSRPPHILFNKLSTRKARRLLRKVTNESRYFAYHDMGCQGRAGRTGCRVAKVAAIFTHAGNPAENTFLAPSPGWRQN